MNRKNVLITGCSSGIGQALAEEYLRQGYRVYATARNIANLAHLTDEQLFPLAMDVNNSDDIAAAIKIITEEDGHLNCLINNAGYAAMGPMAELSHDLLQQQFATNVFAPLALTQATVPLLRAAATEERPAQVVNIGSVSGILTTPFSGAYCATKAALHSISDALRMELAPFGIHVVTVQPGAIQSKFGDNSLANLIKGLKKDSLYLPLKNQMEARATASQDNPTPAEEFARELIAQLLSKPDDVIRIGHGSRILPLIARWLPTSLSDRILSKKFGLNRL